MKYRFKKAACIKADAQVAGEICEALASEDKLTAKNLVEVSRPEDAPLHNAFEWNDTIAAEAYRENQARYIIRSVEIVEEKAEPVRAFFNIEYKEPEYKHIDAILQCAGDRALLLARAMNELKAFEKKYSQLDELAEVFNAIRKLA